jgi:hypothetical protein
MLSVMVPSGSMRMNRLGWNGSSGTGVDVALATAVWVGVRVSVGRAGAQDARSSEPPAANELEEIPPVQG